MFSLITWIKSQDFCPSRAGMLVNSSYLIRRDLASSLKRWSHEMRGTMLDFGCGSMPYRSLFKVEKYLGLEIVAEGHPLRNENATLGYSGDRIPLDDATVDCILMTEVLEHVFNPEHVLKDFNRVLKSGGIVLITCPFVWPLHEEPYDYARYTPFALRYLSESAGFQVVAHENLGCWFLALAQLLLAYFTQTMVPSGYRMNRLIKSFWCVLINPLALMMARLLPYSNRLYLSNFLVLRKI
jgi:SAM-dependent methyltransferase